MSGKYHNIIPLLYFEYLIFILTLNIFQKTLYKNSHEATMERDLPVLFESLVTDCHPIQSYSVDY